MRTYPYIASARAAALALSLEHVDIQFKVVRRMAIDSDLQFEFFIGEPALPKYKSGMFEVCNDTVVCVYWNGRSFMPDEQLTSSNARRI